MKITIEQLSSLAQESSDLDFNWEDLNIEKEEAYQLMASHIIDIMKNNNDSNLSFVLAGVATNLLVENFILNLKNEK
jgi:hypothetical protein